MHQAAEWISFAVHPANRPAHSVHLERVPAERSGDFDAGGATVLQRLAPHVETVLDLRARLQAANQQRLVLAQVFDQLDSGVIVTDASGSPIFVNRRALDITTQSDGLLLGPTGLSGPTPRHTQRLRAVIASVGARPGPNVGSCAWSVRRAVRRCC